MSGLFANIAFLNPWVLTALAILPALYFLLRVTPPAPKIIALPTARFLARLTPDRQTPSRTPLWILLLRLLIAGLIILALARPVYNPASTLEERGAVRLIMDNGWEAAQNWGRQLAQADQLIAQAEREKRRVFIAFTAPAPGQGIPALHGPLSATQAQSMLKGITPMPWAADYKALAESIPAPQDQEGKTHTFFLSAGLTGEGWRPLLDHLTDEGGITLLTPAPEHLPLLLGPAKSRDGSPVVTVYMPTGIAEGLPITLQAFSKDGRLLGQEDTQASSGKNILTIPFDIPEKLRGEINRFTIAGRSGAGALLLLDDRSHRRNVGIAGPADEARTRPFIEARYYLERALEPYADLHTGSIESLLEQDVSVIILPDIAAMPPATLDRLERWVRSGGLLLRFAGPHMAQARAANALTPVPLRFGGRSLEGALSWDTPMGLQAFPKTSPFYGLSADRNVKIRRQILAEPLPDTAQKSWAVLEDGTPLVTAGTLGDGQLVMIHTTAGPEWSDLPLSGLYVEMLRRVISMAGNTDSAGAVNDKTGLLHPIQTLDGFGVLQEPDSGATPIGATIFDTTLPGPAHPPGLYGRGGVTLALNLGERLDRLSALPADLPAGVHVRVYGNNFEQDLMPPLLYTALILLLADWALMGFLAFSALPHTALRLRLFSGKTALFLLSAALSVQAGAALANSSTPDMRYAQDLYLAYVRTGDTALDSKSRAGLDALVEALNNRTSAEPAGVAAIDPAHDTLAFFPLLYWPVKAGAPALSAEALRNVQDYLDHGGTILFDTQDRNASGTFLTGTANAEALRTIASALNIPPLAPIEENHVLGKSFYLLDSYPGRYEGGTLWVEAANSGGGRDGVSPVIIGSHDWATAWADGTPLPGGTRQREMARRFGVNLVMYALTGNYKADQVHVSHILERLGR